MTLNRLFKSLKVKAEYEKDNIYLTYDLLEVNPSFIRVVIKKARKKEEFYTSVMYVLYNTTKETNIMAHTIAQEIENKCLKHKETIMNYFKGEKK